MASSQTLLLAKSGSSSFTYLAEWQALLCRDCGFCIFPGRSSQARHLRSPPHHLRGVELASLLELFTSYTLRPPLTIAEREGLPPNNSAAPPLPSKAIDGLQLRPGFSCLLCGTFLSCHLKTVQRHISKQHGLRPAEQAEGAAYAICTLQTFFAEKKYIEYFCVDASSDAQSATSYAITPAEEAFLQTTLKVQEESRVRRTAVASLVAPLDTHKSAVIPWLRATGIAEHLQGLEKDEIATAIALPSPAEEETDLVLPRLLIVLDYITSEAHRWCFPRRDEKLTWQRQLALNHFQAHTPLATASASRRLKGFDPYKGALTFERYVRT